ncbi:MAG: S-adenosylmethionine:tRNA ribosyltransferase-isomerase, partial [Thermoleophilia bacterium]
MRLEELDFVFPEELIAQRPCDPRDACRLLVGDPATASIADRTFAELPTLLRPGDVLVLNESKVLPARVWATKDTGGKVELLFLRRVEEPSVPSGPLETPREAWEVLARPSARLRPGLTLHLAGDEALALGLLIG